MADVALFRDRLMQGVYFHTKLVVSIPLTLQADGYGCVPGYVLRDFQGIVVQTIEQSDRRTSYSRC